MLSPKTNTMKKLGLVLMLLAVSFVSLWGKSIEFIVLQMNVWHEGTQVKGGFEAIADEVARLSPDIVMFSEIRNYHGKKFIPRILEALKKRGAEYNGYHSDFGDCSLLTKFKILEHHPIKEQRTSMSKTRIEIDGKQVVVYACHLNYTNDATFLPRGYDGNTWKKLDAPVTDVKQIEQMMHNSFRGEGIRAAIKDAENEQDHIVIIGGDFNEASHLDWNEETKDLWDHNGTVVNWECSNELISRGYKDAYREIYPNPITHPGFTFPADNKDVSIEKLAWAPDADERCRLDFVYFMPNKKLKVKDAIIVGPDCSIIRGERAKETSKDKFITPLGVWPTDHKAMLVTFKLKK